MICIYTVTHRHFRSTLLNNALNILHVLPSGTRQYCMHGWVGHIDNVCVGHIHMLIEANNKIKFLDAWVHEEYRRQGIFRTLWDTRWEYVQQNYPKYTAYAWCKPMSLPLLLERGFTTGDSSIYVEREVIRSDKPKDKPPHFTDCPVTC